MIIIIINITFDMKVYGGTKKKKKQPCNELSKKHHKETRCNDDGVVSMKTIFRDGQQHYTHDDNCVLNINFN